MSATWEKMCSADDIPAGERKRFPFGALDILIINTGKRFYACVADCPHRGGSLEDAELHGHILLCKADGYKFDLATGRCPTDGDLELTIFRTEIRDGALWVKN